MAGRPDAPAMGGGIDLAVAAHGVGLRDEGTIDPRG
jgi:hypothetical protein